MATPTFGAEMANPKQRINRMAHIRDNTLFVALLLVLATATTCRGFVIVPQSSVGLRSVPRPVSQNGIKPQFQQQALRKSSSAQFIKFWEGEETQIATKSDDDSSDLSGLLIGDLPDRSSGEVSSRLSLILVSAEDALTPAIEFLDEVSGGWALGYADLSPESEETPVGQAFLATNLAYAAVGVLLGVQGDPFLGLLTEICSVCSFIYHFTQLQAGDNSEDKAVRLALLVDYFCACSTILVAIIYIISDQQLPPMEGIVSGGMAVACLLACWVWEKGLPYIVLHSFWHLFSAYAGYAVGTSHLA
jgi:hypothetical protein